MLLIMHFAKVINTKSNIGITENKNRYFTWKHNLANLTGFFCVP